MFEPFSPFIYISHCFYGLKKCIKMKHLFDLKAYNLSIVSYGKQKLYWFSRVFFLLFNEKLEITSACLDLSLDMEGPADNSAGHIDSSGFFSTCATIFPQKRLGTVAGDDCSALTGDWVCSYTPNYGHTSTLVAGVGLWCTWDAMQHQRIHQ